MNATNKTPTEQEVVDMLVKEGFRVTARREGRVYLRREKDGRTARAWVGGGYASMSVFLLIGQHFS